MAAGWELLPRGARVLLGILCLFLALPAAAMAALALFAILANLRDPGALIPSFVALLLAGLFAWALGAVGWRMLRAPGE